MVNRVINRMYGRRDKRLYIRLNDCQYAGLTLLAHRRAQSENQAAYTVIMRELEHMRVFDPAFAKEWERACQKVVKKESGQ